jgi:hypothetical protein
MKLPLSLLMLFGTYAISYSQEQTSTLENGVVVHHAVGMEGPVQPSPTTNAQARTINDWNLAECLETLEIINLKCQQIPVEECNSYAPLIQSIQQRIAVLNQVSE